METQFITLDPENTGREHICCAFSDKKCSSGYELKKQWLTGRFADGLVFRRLNARAKVFIEYMPAEKAWVPVEAPGYLCIGCFWVAGQYKGQGYGKALLASVVEDARKQGKSGIVAVAGTKKLHYLPDAKWLLRQGFEITESLPYGFSLLVKKLHADASSPSFRNSVLGGECPEKKGLVAYYTNRCPFTDFYVNTVLKESAEKRNLPLQIIRIETYEQAQAAPSPATIFSLFYKGKYLTNDISVSLGDRLDKILE